MTGGESAADVLLALNNYRAANDREVYGDDFVNGQITDGKYADTPEYPSKSRIDTLAENVTALGQKDTELSGAIDLRLTIADFNQYKEEAEGKFVDNTEIAGEIETINKAIDDVDTKADNIAKDLTAADERLTGAINGALGRLGTAEAKLEGIEAGAEVNVIEKITYNGTEVEIDATTKTAKIVDNYRYELPVATTDTLGGVKSSPRVVDEETGAVTTAVNSVNVAADGKMTVNSLDVERLVQTGVLVLYGGSASDNL
jgi:hypothetical protein